MKKKQTTFAFTREAVYGSASPAHDRATKTKKRTEKPHAAKPQSMPSFLHQGVRIEVLGFGLVRLLNELRAAGIEVRALVQASRQKTFFTVSEKQSAKTFAILEKLCYTYRVVGRASMRSAWATLCAKAGLLVAAVVLTAALVVGYGFVWRIDITGCQKTERAVIERFLRENGIGIGTQKTSIDPTRVRSLVNSFDDVLEASVTVDGVTLRIEVTETTDYTVPNQPSDYGVYSRYDATVTRVIAESGTPLVHPGSRVFRGATLIGAYRIDQAAQQVAAPAVGQVFGTVVFADSFDFSLTETTQVRTGRVWRMTEMRMFAFGSKQKEQHNFKLYECESETVYAFQNLFIPLKVRSTAYYELTETTQSYDLDERIRTFTETAVLRHAIELGDNDYTVITKLEPLDETAYRLHTFLQAELMIGQN